MKRIEGGVTAPRGFRASGVIAGIKPSARKKDCALIVSDAPTTVAGAFTRNVMKSPPVYWNVDVCKNGAARAVFINSGNANAATGERGHADVKNTIDHISDKLQVEPEEVCVCSTGVIGVPLPMDRIHAGIDACIDALSTDGSLDAATAIMTTDTVPKELAVEVTFGEGTVRLGAIAKGSGMLSPNMATMICVITTDAAIDPDALQPALKLAVESSFNQICVDNDMSTSDTVLVFANGQSGLAPLKPGDGNYSLFADALLDLCRNMAKALVKDGEGATKFVEIVAEGAESDGDAKSVVRAIGNSQLCKTAFFGEDPNWGRFACAAGYAGVEFDPAALNIWLDEIQLCRNGLVGDYEEADAAAVMKKPEFTIRVSIGNGPGTATFWTSDLSHEYVSINADYRS